MIHYYRTTVRPASTHTLPPGLKWFYVEAPARFGYVKRDDLPVSIYPYGIIQTDRALTADEMVRYSIEKV